MAVEWPQEVDTSEGLVVVYQPQPEKLNGNLLSARSAMSFQLQNKDPIFGVFWFTAKIDTDRSTDHTSVRDLNVTRVRWPDSKDAGEQRFISALNHALKNVEFVTSLSQLTASLESAQAAKKSLTEIKNEPPKIVFEKQLAILLSFDGEAKFGAIENSPYERALNTTMTVVRDTKSTRIYLTNGYTWYQAKDINGPYHETKTVPADLVEMAPKSEGLPTQNQSALKIVVATEPTELIASDGPPNWKSLAGGELIYVSNTETPWLRELKTSNMYVLLSGRWFRAKKETGPWTFVRADELPKSFANIPPASDLGSLRVSVAGTEEANEAILDAHIPQTAAISRKDTRLTVTYDGEPKFEIIPGTQVSYAENTDSQVIKVENKFYAVDNAVWFKADTALGPWKVADQIPKNEIAKIPPSSPVYNITYVDIYESTPEIVYVGYYPGYMWSYPYYGVPVYGTGWYYPPYWRGGYYYPRPPTWGLHVGYNSWSGWNVGVSWSNGFFSVGMNWNAGYRGPHHPPHYGPHPGGHRGPVVINTGNINIGNNVNIGNNHKTNNLYKRAENSKRNASPSQVKRDLKTARNDKSRRNNVFADKDGNALKRDGDKWQQRNNGKWQDLGSSQQQSLNNKSSNVERDKIKNSVNNINHDKSRSTIQNKASSRQAQQKVYSTQRFQSSSNRRMENLNNASRARQQGRQRQQIRQLPLNMRHRGH